MSKSIRLGSRMGSHAMVQVNGYAGAVKLRIEQGGAKLTLNMTPEAADQVSAELMKEADIARYQREVSERARSQRPYID